MLQQHLQNRSSAPEDNMRIRMIMASVFALGVLSITCAKAQAPKNLQEAKALSSQSGKPLLIEFFRQG